MPDHRKRGVLRTRASEMSAGGGRRAAEELTELNRVSEEQLEAARAGDLERLQRLLAARRQLLVGLAGHRVEHEQLQRAWAAGREALTILRAEAGRLEGRLLRLQVGRRALPRYHLPVSDGSGFVDQVR